MEKIDNMPDRPLYLHEIKMIEEENEEVEDAAGIFYEGGNINGAICIFLNVKDTAYIIGFNNASEEWVKLSMLNNEEKSIEDYNNESSNIVTWFNNKYGEDGYGIYKMYKQDNN